MLGPLANSPAIIGANIIPIPIMGSARDIPNSPCPIMPSLPAVAGFANADPATAAPMPICVEVAPGGGLYDWLGLPRHLTVLAPKLPAMNICWLVGLYFAE